MTSLSTDGKFDICGRCKAHQHCCARIHTGNIESPFLTPSEASAISHQTSLSQDEFSERADAGSQLISLKSRNGNCYFYNKGKCSIYDSRPLDCRLFPFDIIETADENFFWIVYNELCPEKFDYRDYFDAAKRLLANSCWSRDEIRDFASHGGNLVRSHSHTVIEPVVFTNGQPVAHRVE